MRFKIRRFVETDYILMYINLAFRDPGIELIVFAETN